VEELGLLLGKRLKQNFWTVGSNSLVGFSKFPKRWVWGTVCTQRWLEEFGGIKFKLEVLIGLKRVTLPFQGNLRG